MSTRDFFIDKDYNRDPLTGVYNREIMYLYMDYLITLNKPFSYAILDVDNFKFINDTFGHSRGDVFLKEITNQITEAIGDRGVIGRYGGDEFIFIFEDVQDYDALWKICFDIIKSPKPIDDPELSNYNFSYTLGVSRFPFDTDNKNGLFDLADKALYRGKTKGRNCFIIYLVEKHANIDLKSQREKEYTSMFLHSQIYNGLTSNINDLPGCIQTTITYIANHLMIDHMCIEDSQGMMFEYVHKLSKKKDFKPVGMNLLGLHINKTSGLFSENCLQKTLYKSPLIDSLIKEEIYSAVAVEIKVYGKLYGYLRCDIASMDTGRIWQRLHFDLLLGFCHTLAFILYAKNITLEDLRKK